MITLHRCLIFSLVLLPHLSAQVTTTGFQNLARPEAPGTLLSHPVTNGSEPIGRTTSINYLNGWVIVGGEAPGSRVGSDLQMRVFDIADPQNPVRRLPSDFGLSYPNNSWVQGNYGWNAHGTAQSGNLLLPDPIRVTGFGGLVERAGSNGVPYITNLPLWFNRSSQAGPWDASMLWYGTEDQDFEIARIRPNNFGTHDRRVVATFDHVGPYGGGEWHPMFFGDLLIYARSGGAASDGVVVYRLSYQNMDDADPSNDSITPQLVGTLSGGFQGYWPNLFSDGTGLYVIGSTTDILIGADITSATMPGMTPNLQTVASLTVPDFTNASYPAYQDNFGFIHNRKVDMTRFLAGDANPIVLTLNEANPPRPAGAPALPPGAIAGVNTSQMSLPLGNLWLTGGYPIPNTNQGLGVWVHQQAPDTTAPRVSYHIPQAGRTNYPRHAPLSFLIHEYPRNGGPRNGIDFLVRAVNPDESLGSFVPGFLIHDFSGNMTFTPDAPLTAETTYQVDFPSDPAQEIGFRDSAGNYIEPHSFRFSTGGGLNAPEPPVFSGLDADNHQPAPGEQVTVTAAATGQGALEFRFNFDGSWGAWNASPAGIHTYATTGRPRVIVQVRDASGNIVTDSLRLLVITPPPAGLRPTQSGTLAIGDDPGGRRVWSVNPDSDTVTVIDTASGAKLAEHAVGESPRGIARDANGRYWITCHGSDEIRVLNPDGTSFRNITLDYGDAPFAVAPSPDGTFLYVTLYGSGEIRRYSAANPEAAYLSAGGLSTPRALAVSADGSRVFVTRFISPELQGEISEFSATLGFTRLITLTSSNSSDGGDRAAGVPNYLSGIAISPDGTRASVVSKQDNIQRGTFFGVGDLTHETTVRSVISFIDLTANAEIPHSRRDFDNSGNPSAVTYTPLGDTILVAHEGNNRVAGIDALNLAPLSVPFTTGSMLTQPAVLTLDVGTGLAPQGLLIDSVSGRLFTQDFMGRSVTVRDAAPLLDDNETSLPLLATTAAVSAELLDPDVLQGKRIFYNAADPRMSADSYISCASCHIDGGHDGRVWDFTGRGEGFRRTTDLRGRSGMGHGAVHWSGNFDEIQDFEHDIRGPFGGTGFLADSPQQFASRHPGPASGKAGLSADLDALAAYVRSLSHEHTPRSPARNTDGTLTTAAVRGQAVFNAQNCASCHSGQELTNSALLDVGTQSALSGLRLGQALPGIDTPTLHGLHATRLYLHHGQAENLTDFFGYAGGTFVQAAAGESFGGGVTLENDTPAEGGGGFGRGYLGGTAMNIDGTDGASGVRFTNVDGGAGGAARITLRYAKRYSNGTARIRVNGSEQLLSILRQFPDNSWQTSGWRHLTVNATLNPGATNTIEVVRGNTDFALNSILIANASDLAAAAPHRLVNALPAGDRADLFAYLMQLDGRDANGTPLAAPPAPMPTGPAIVTAPQGATLAEGNGLNLFVSVSGTGPFDFEWMRGSTVVGTNSPELEIAAVTPADSGDYTVFVSNAQGNVTSAPAIIVVNPPLQVTSTSLPTAVVGVPYTYNLSASGGISSRTWSLDAGALPLGFSLSPTGQLSGNTAAPAVASFTVRVSDSSGSDARVLSLDVTPVAGFATDPDLILHYTFDEGGGNVVWDSATASNNHSTQVSGAHWIPEGRFGGAYGLANTSATIQGFFPANQADLDFDPRGDEYTISVWARSTTTGGYNTILGKGRNTEPWDVQYRLWMTNTGGFLQPVNGGQYGPNYDISGNPINNGNWQLVTMVNTNVAGTWRTRVHYNGGPAIGEFATGASGRLPGLLRIGDTTRGGNSWNGQLDDLRIYRRALSQAEISELYTAPDVLDFDDWAASSLTAAQLANPGLSGPSGDANGDGVANAIEFALGGGQPLGIRLEGSNSVLTFGRNSLARNLRLIVECSPDLNEWTAIATGINGLPPTGQGVATSETQGIFRETTLTHQYSGSRGFYRIRIVIE
ncbi:Ig-like domain-containing protein [Akkermansiaceae bacterium]|nr:Ig-like domain-containing protein [Akkermansiaceae bacterium]